MCLCESVCYFTSPTAVAAAATNKLCVCVSALMLKKKKIAKLLNTSCHHSRLCSALDQKISVGKDLFALASSRERTFSTSPAVSIEKLKRDPAVLARCSTDLPILLFVPMQKLYPWCCQNSWASSFGKLWLLILFIYLSAL